MRITAAVMEKADGLVSRRSIALQAIDDSDAGATVEPILTMT